MTSPSPAGGGPLGLYRRVLFAFAVGVSFAATLGSLSQVAWAGASGPSAGVGRARVDVAVRLLYGVTNVANVLLGNSVESSLGSGLVLGILFVGGTRRFATARFLFGEDRDFLLLLVPTFWFAFVIRFLNQRLFLW